MERFFLEPPQPPFTGRCTVCEQMLDREWPTNVQAQDDAVWHVYREHPEHWKKVIGDRPPRNPDPREGETRWRDDRRPST